LYAETQAYNPENYPKVSQQVLGFSAVVLQTLYYRLAHNTRTCQGKMDSRSRIMSHHIWIALQDNIKSEAPDYIYLSSWTTRTTNTQWLRSKPEAFLILCVLMQSASQQCL
jgi:hypothetical protein